MEDEIIDVEEFSKAGKTPPKGKKYRIKIDREKYVVHQECMTGKELLQLAGKNPPDKFLINQKLKGGKVENIALNEKVCFTTPGIEKFVTLPVDQTEGEPDELRRQFALLDEDTEFLDNLGLRWEALIDPHGKWVLIHDYSIRDGYNVKNVLLAIKMEPGYPRAQLDMAFFYPALSRADQQPINAVTPLIIDQKNFQQWSRHRTPQNPWREGIDNLATHVSLVPVWLEQEFEKRPNVLAA